jgi:hypothetical protein
VRGRKRRGLYTQARGMNQKMADEIQLFFFFFSNKARWKKHHKNTHGL